MPVKPDRQVNPGGWKARVATCLACTRGRAASARLHTRLASHLGGLVGGACRQHNKPSTTCEPGVGGACRTHSSVPREHRPPGVTPVELDWLMRGRPRTCPHHRRRRQTGVATGERGTSGVTGGQDGGYTQRKRRPRRDRCTRAGPGPRGLCPAVHGTGVGICSNLGPTVAPAGSRLGATVQRSEAGRQSVATMRAACTAAKGGL